MGTKYKRVQDVEEKIHSAKLPYNAWKVFFLIDGEVGVEKIAEFLEEENSVVEKSLQKLTTEGLVEVTGGEEEVVPEAVELPDQVDEPAIEESEEVEIPEQVEEPESKVEAEVELELEPEPEPESEVEAETEEALDLSIDEELTETVDEPVSEEELAEDEPDLTDDLISVVEDEEEVVEEIESTEDDTLADVSLDNLDLEDTVEMESAPEMDVEVESDEDETLEIDLPEDVEEKVEEDLEGTDLDIDFSSEEPTQEVVEEAPQPEVVEPKEPTAEEAADMKTILVVDDSIVIRKMVEIALEDENYKIETAVSGKDGLTILDDKNPNLMILDLMLPDINGIDLLKTVKASKGIPVIMLSGKDSPQMVEKARSEGADAFLPKPFKDDELVAKIHELLS